MSTFVTFETQFCSISQKHEISPRPQKTWRIFRLSPVSPYGKLLALNRAHSNGISVALINFRVILLLVGLFSQSCVIFSRPRGAWADPVILDLHEKSLADKVISVECEMGDFAGGPTEKAILNSCRDIIALVKSMGATVEADEALLPQRSSTDDENQADASEAESENLPPPDLKLTYIDRDYTNDWCGWTLPFFIFSWSTFPCVVDSSHRAELLIHSSQGQLLDQRELLTDGKAFYGIGALPVLALKYIKRISNGTRYERELAQNLYHHIRAAVYTAHIRQSLNQGRRLQSSNTTEGGKS